MTVFERAIPLSARIQWLMLKTALEQDLTAEALAKRLGWSVNKVRQIVWSSRPGKVRMGTVAEWVFACSGQRLRLSLEKEKAE